MKIIALLLLAAFGLTACEVYDEPPVYRRSVYVSHRSDDDDYYYAPRRRVYYGDGYACPRPYYGRSRVIVY